MIHFSMSFSKARHLRKSVKNYSKKNTNECWKLLGRDYAMNNVSTSFERALTVLGSTKLRLETNQLRLFLCSCHKEFSLILSQAEVLMMFWVCPIPPQTKKSKNSFEISAYFVIPIRTNTKKLLICFANSEKLTRASRVIGRDLFLVKTITIYEYSLPKTLHAIAARRFKITLIQKYSALATVA